MSDPRSFTTTSKSSGRPRTFGETRDGRHLTLARISELSGLDTGMLSRLENGKILNPTLSTLWRYAGAIGVRVDLVVQGVPAGDDAAAWDPDEHATPMQQAGD